MGSVGRLPLESLPLRKQETFGAAVSQTKRQAQLEQQVKRAEDNCRRKDLANKELRDTVNSLEISLANRNDHRCSISCLGSCFSIFCCSNQSSRQSRSSV